MIAALADLGKTQRITILLDYEGDNATVTVLFKPKDDKGTIIHPLNFSGPVDEVDGHIGGGLEESLAKISTLHSNIKEVEAEMEKQVAAKKEEAAKKPEPEAKKEDKKDKGGRTPKPKPVPPADPSKKTTPLAEIKPGYKAAAPEAPPPAAEQATTPAAKDELMKELFPE